MYSVVLVTHSWLRFVVLALGLWLLFVSIRGMYGAGSWARLHERSHIQFIGALDIQLLLGLLLYFVLSPIVAAARADFRGAMGVAELRFFALEHLTVMLVAVIVAHVGRIVSQRRSGHARFRAVLITQALWVVLTLLAIPWPGIAAGRPLFRL